MQDVALTTNGVLLAQHAAELKANGLHRITVSLDTLDPEIFKQMSGGFAERDRVLEGIRAAQDAGLTPIKINCVVERGLNDHTALDLVEHFRGTGVIVRFIEYMDVGNRNHWSRDRVVPRASCVERIGARWPLHAVEENYRGEVAERYAFDDGAGEVGFISSVTNPFCGSCTRARLSSEGVFYTCLFARSGAGSARAAARWRDETSCARSSSATRWTRRGDRYSELRSSLQPASSRCARSRCITSAADASQCRMSSFSHVDSAARPTMVDVGDKAVTKRTATAQTRVRFPREVAEALRGQQFNTPKGPVFQTAIIAGTMAAKRTHELIPFCHPLGIESCKLAIDMEGDDAVVRCTVSVHHKTGVEMEALTGASVAALTIYDMCKALSHDIVIAETRLVEKRGGKSDSRLTR